MHEAKLLTRNRDMLHILLTADAARQSNSQYSVAIYFRSIYLSIYVCLSADFRRCKAPGNRLTPVVAYTV